MAAATNSRAKNMIMGAGIGDSGLGIRWSRITGCEEARACHGTRSRCPGFSNHESRIPNPGSIKTPRGRARAGRSEKHTSELQSLMRLSYAVFCLKNKTHSLHNKEELLSIK